MIRANIKEIAIKNEITTAYQLQKLMNLQPSQAAKLYRNDLKMIGFDTLNELCKVFKCLPSDILVYEPDDETPQNAPAKAQKRTSNASKPKKASAVKVDELLPDFWTVLEAEDEFGVDESTIKRLLGSKELEGKKISRPGGGGRGKWVIFKTPENVEILRNQRNAKK